MDTAKRMKLIEIFKSVLLVVLFLSTILLLYFFWGYAQIQSLIRDNPSQYEIIDPGTIFKPSHVSVCFGGNSYTVLDEKFGVMMDCLKTFSGNKNLSVGEIQKESYEELMKYPSMKAVFDYYAPFSAFCEIYGVERISGAEVIDAMSEFAYAVGSDDCVYVADKRVDKYYIISGSANSCFNTLKGEIETARGNSVSFFTLSTYMGGEIENYALCPESFASPLYDIYYQPENFSARAEETENIVRSFFSENFDFVRRIEEKSGTTIYMYGYGKIVVIARDNGVLEFKMEDEERSTAQIRYLEAFDRASAFIAAHGGFKSIDGVEFAPYIKDVIIDPEGKRGYRFVFGIRINGAGVYYQNGDPVIIDVIGGRVSYFKRELLNTFTNGYGVYRDAFSAINLLAGNFEYINAALAENPSEKISFEGIVERVTSFDCGYVRSDTNASFLEAAWIVNIGGLEFYFDLDNGKPLGHRHNE